MTEVRTVVFDLGGVLVDWNPRYLFRKLLATEEEVEQFLTTICTQAWNEQQDAGRSLAEATRELVEHHPEHEALITAYYDRWEEMLAGEIAGTVAVLESLKARATHQLLALTNFSAETFPVAQRRFAFLGHFEDILVSGEVGLKKPDPQIFHLLLQRHQLEPTATVFIDDAPHNVDAARDIGMHAVQFTDADALRESLADLGVHT